MFPLFPFAAGLLTGAVAIKLIRSEKAKKQLDKAQDRLREATFQWRHALDMKPEADDQPKIQKKLDDALGRPVAFGRERDLDRLGGRGGERGERGKQERERRREGRP